MRCPKCQYISFDSGDRCRNCGYEFSLSVEEPPLDVTIARDEPGPGRLRDGSFTALDAPLAARAPVFPEEEDVHGQFPPELPSESDLPLFTERVADDQAPLVAPPAVPRAPLSVRRTSPAARGRGRSPQPQELSLDLDPDADAPAIEQHEDAGRFGDAAGLVRRTLAGLVDVVILGAIAAAVLYLTLRLCELTLDDWRRLPAVPFAAFLLLVCGGYFVLFTAAGGQTIGKMIAGIRVVACSDEDPGLRRVSFGTALLRALACLGSVVVLGAGFLPALFSADRRAFHDRVAETRVVTA